MELKNGDIVQLNSGGPKMTIETVVSKLEKPYQVILGRKGVKSNYIKCIWFVGTENKENYFAPETLKKIESE